MASRTIYSNFQGIGMKAENMDDLVMNIFGKNSGLEKEDDIFKLIKPFKYIAIENYLSVPRKFGGQSEEVEKKDIKKLISVPISMGYTGKDDGESVWSCERPKRV